MGTVVLTEQEWHVVMAMLSNAPWKDANPLLMKIGAQLQQQQTNTKQQTNSQETPAAQGDVVSSRAN